jgi:hypothetical protein
MELGRKRKAGDDNKECGMSINYHVPVLCICHCLRNQTPTTCGHKISLGVGEEPFDGIEGGRLVTCFLFYFHT